MRSIPIEGLMYVLFGIAFIILPFATSLYDGRAIVATKVIDEEPFKQSVVYIYKHNLFNAYGLFLNKPLTAEERAQVPEEIRNIKHLYKGGIVDFPAAITIAEIDSNGYEVELKVKSLKRALEEDSNIIDKIKKQGAAGHIRLFAGYLGWGILQLDREAFGKNAWSGIHLDRDLIYTADPYEMWEKAGNHSENRWEASGI